MSCARRMAAWFRRRYGLPRLDAATEVLPVNGTREALFAFAQAVVDPSRAVAGRRLPEPVLPDLRRRGAARRRRAGVPQPDARRPALPSTSTSLDDDQWRRTQLMYVCSPGNPTGRVLTSTPGGRCSSAPTATGSSSRPTSAIRRSIRTKPRRRSAGSRRRTGWAATDFRNLVVFTSLSKRSNAPGLRSGGVAGDAALLKRFLLYRTYHGCAMSLAVQHASIAAWSDEAHVRDNRAQYREKFAAVVPMLGPVLDVRPAGRRLLSVGAACPAATTRRLRGSCSRRRT